MDKTSLNIRLKYNEMGKTEKRIADWIEKNPGKIISLSIVELAELCKCSEATVVRFSKRLGLSGYQELKISLASEGGSTVISTGITSDDTAHEMYEKLCNDIYLSLERTKKSLNKNSINESADKICKANKIIIMGLGNSASIALDASHKFLRTGLNAYAYTDNHMQMIASSHLDKNDVAIGITHSGSSKDIVEALKTAKNHGATTICITNKGKSPVLKYCDYVLATDSEETKYSILALNSRIAQLVIIDTLYSYVVCNLSEHAQESIKETERSLLTKKY